MQIQNTSFNLPTIDNEITLPYTKINPIEQKQSSNHIAKVQTKMSKINLAEINDRAEKNESNMGYAETLNDREIPLIDNHNAEDESLFDWKNFS